MSKEVLFCKTNFVVITSGSLILNKVRTYIFYFLIRTKFCFKFNKYNFFYSDIDDSKMPNKVYTNLK